MTFKITDHLEFNSKGRASCPCCEVEGKHHNQNLSLVPNTDGAYKCHRGCTPQQIREALGNPKPSVIPTAIAKPTAAPGSLTVSPQKVREACEKLMNSDGPAKEWLHQRGITDEMIAHFRLGIVRAKSGEKHLPAISIPIPNTDGTAFYQKKRVAPWLSPDQQPSGYQPWSQAGIPARVFFTHLPVEAKETWLCEGEWDAILLGWHVRQTKLPIAIACFTAGCGNVPPPDQLNLLPGTIITFYDRNDKPLKNGDRPGEVGAKKVAAALGDRARIGLVPMTDGCEINGWDVSNAINAGWKLEDFQKAAAQAERFNPTKTDKVDNPLKTRLQTNAQLLESAPDYVEWLVPDLLPANELILLAASPRAGKSLFAMLLSKCIATGDNFLDRPVTQGSVLYVRCEDAPVKIKQRQLAQGWSADTPVYWLDRFKLSQVDYLRDLAEEIDSRLIVLDTLSRVRDDGITESSAEMSRVLEPLQELAEDLNCCIMPVHHTNKISVENAGTMDVFDTIRGSSAIRATCRGTLVLAADNECYRLCAENGYGKTDLKIRLDQTTLEWKLMGRWQPDQIPSDQRAIIEDYLNKVGQATLEGIFEDTQIPKSSLYKVLSRLTKEGFITKAGNRRQVLYTRSSDFIRLSDELSDDEKPDGVRHRDTYLTKNIFSISSRKVISDHTSHAKDDHLASNDHLFEGG